MDEVDEGGLSDLDLLTITELWGAVGFSFILKISLQDWILAKSLFKELATLLQSQDIRMLAYLVVSSLIIIVNNFIFKVIAEVCN